MGVEWTSEARGERQACLRITAGRDGLSLGSSKPASREGVVACCGVDHVARQHGNGAEHENMKSALEVPGLSPADRCLT
jgi:hypothetical protein